jgi:hypothetical protein
MSDSNQKITHLLVDQIPDYVQEFFPLFVTFITKYFTWLETAGDQNSTSVGTQFSLQNLQLNRDIDTTAQSLQKEFLHSFVPNLPDTLATDPTIFIKFARQFYQLKGSEKSFRLFFRAFFDDEIEISYPRDYLFKPSASNWYSEKTIRISSVSGDPNNLMHTLVTGVTSKAYATVNNVVQVVGAGGANYYDLVLQPASWVGTFTTGETVVGFYNNFAGTSSYVTSIAVSSVIAAPGKFLDDVSQLSTDQVLQDSLYYQQYSYVVKTREERSRWYDAVLSQLHPTGTRLFNEYLSDTMADFSTSNTTAICINNRTETTVRIPSIKTYLTAPTFTFDRTADEQTGTSTTKVATTTGFTTITYTSIGSITRSATYDYQGENITWALQNLNDYVTYGVQTETTRIDGPSFDKLSRAVGLDPQLIPYPLDVNTSIVVMRYVTASSNLTAGSLLTSFTTQTLAYSSALQNSTSVGSMIMLVTWVKTSQGNNAAGESSNAVVISFSSNVTVIPYFDEYTQRNLKRIALGDSLDYNKLVYFHSSNSVSSNLVSDVPTSSYTVTTSSSRIIFKPYNWERGQSYDRCAIRFEIDQITQLNTSLSETFTSTNITSTGLIASWSSLATSVAINAFGGSTSNTIFAFSSNCFVFNGPFSGTSQSRFVTTTSFIRCARLDATLSYLVGDNYNGGEIPDSGDDLEVQYSLNGGSSYFTAAKLWEGSTSNLWTYGTTSLSGKVYAEPGSNTVTGFGTLFSTVVNVGDRITIDSSLNVTAYTVTTIANNNVLTVTPNFTASFRGLISSTGVISGGINGTQVSGTGTTFATSFRVGEYFSLANTSTTTAYVITSITDDTNMTIAPIISTTFTDSNYYKITGTTGFYKLPASRQFNTTSITVYGPGPETSVMLRVIQNYQTQVNDDAYALDYLNVNSFRYQATTGNINISVAVSSNSTLNINDNDFFTITTIGT